MSKAELLTAQFYAWEKRLRGYNLYPYPVPLEPPFEPFFYHYVPTSPITDDSLKPSIFNRFIESVKIGLSHNQKVEEVAERSDMLCTNIFGDDKGLTALSISLPKELRVSPEGMEHLLLMLSQTQYPISFEIIANHYSILLQFVCRETDVQFVHNQIKAYFPSCGIQVVDVNNIIPQLKKFISLDFGLREEAMRPIATHRNFEIDSLIGVFGVLENLKQDEQLVIQLLFQGAKKPWAESIIRSVMDSAGGSFFLDAPEMLKLAQDKVLSPLYAVSLRVIGFNNDGDQSGVKRLASALIQTTQTNFNGLIPLYYDDFDSTKMFQDILLRQSHRSGMLLNSRELVNLLHFPSISIISQKLNYNVGKTKVAPAIFHDHKLVLGINNHQGEYCDVTISDTSRLKHTHIIGATGTGKSTLLQANIIQDMFNGEGIAVIDPHGDLIESVISWVHPDRHKDVIVIDPSDSEFPVGFNILTAHSEIEKDILSSDLVAAFRRLSTSWGDQMNSVFANAILAFLESTKGGTLIQLRRFLIEKSYRDKFLATVADPSIVYYWRYEFPLLKSSSIGPILTRLDAFLRPKVIRNMVAQNKSLDFEEILNSKKIVLIKLSQGLIGVENSYLLGTFLVSKIQQAAMARQAKNKALRTNFYLYIDEFQNFITPSMSAILSGARKYHLGLILVHQDMQQLAKQDTEIASSVIANAGTRICFRLGDTDAKRFGGTFSFFDEHDLQNLDTGQAIIRLERPENDCNLQTISVQELETDVASQIKDLVIGHSRATYGTPKAEVEALLKDIHSNYEYLTTTNEPKVNEAFKPVKPKPQPQVKSEPFKPVPTKDPQIKKQETQHRYLQTLIKHMAESRGYISSIEEKTPDGRGRVDVSLKRKSKSIAVEIKETTKDEWELHNIEKCLEVGYDIVVACSTDTKVLSRMSQKIGERFDPEQSTKIMALTPESLFLFLDSEIAKEASTDVRMKGYRVKVDYDAVSEQDMVRKREIITKSVVEGLRGK